MNSETGGILGVFGFLASMAGLLYTAINHKKIRCRCCGKDLDMSVDIDETDGAKKKAAEPETPVEETAEEEESVVKPEPSESKRNYKNSKVVPVESS
jgi:hypothetical protein